MKKRFVVPELVEEASLAVLTRQLVSGSQQDGVDRV